MAFSMPVVRSERHRMHEPLGEIWVGVRTVGTEVPARVDRVLEALAGAPLVDAEPHPDQALLAVHDRALLAYLAEAWEEWEAAGLTEDPGAGTGRPLRLPPARPVRRHGPGDSGGGERPRRATSPTTR